YVQHLGQPQHHGAAGHGPSGLHEADVTRGHVRLDRQVQLAQPAPLPPLPHQRAEPGGQHLGPAGVSAHVTSLTRLAVQIHYVGGNCGSYPGRAPWRCTVRREEPIMRSHGDAPTAAPIPRWLRFVLASDRAGSSWYVGLGFFFAPALAIVSPWQALTTALWVVIAVAGLWLGLLGVA